MEVRFHHAARAEFNALPELERDAMIEAIEKLELYADQLAYPHTSRVRGPAGLRELRPRAGRSPWRAFYRRVGPIIVVGTFGPEAQVDRRGFARAAGVADERIAEVERRREEL